CTRASFFFSSRRRHTRSTRDWSSDVCSSDLIWVEKMRAAAVPYVPLPMASEVDVRLETQDQLAELDRRAREVVFLRVDFQDTERSAERRGGKGSNSRRARTTWRLYSSA